MADDTTTASALPALELTLPVDPPVVSYGRTVDRITLREPTVADLASADAYEGYRWRQELVARVSGLSSEAVGRLGISLLNDCADFLGAWMGARRNLPLTAAGDPAALTLSH